MRHPKADGAVRRAPQAEDRRRSEAGDTLVEILITLAVIGIAATAIMLAFATSISGSGSHRNVATMDTMLRTAAAEVSAAIQNQIPNSTFANCSGASVVNGNTALYIPLPDPNYTASITQAEYWSSTTASFSSPVTPPGTSCPGGPGTGGGPQLLTVTVAFHGSGGTTTSSIATVVDDPIAPSGGGTCQYAASQLVWVQQPINGTAGSALYPAPSVVFEDPTGCVVQNDASQVQLAIKAGTGTPGATLNNCLANLGSGQTSFLNCTISTLGTGYTLTASDPSDPTIPNVTSNPFNITAGVPAKLAWSIRARQRPRGAGADNPTAGADRGRLRQSRRR